MRWLRLYLSSRRIGIALVVAVVVVAIAWTLTLRFADSRTITARPLGLAVMLAVVAFASTLGAHDEALERTASMRWPGRRLGHLLLVGAVVTGLVLLPAVGDGRVESSLVLRDTAGLLGLTALGAAVGGATRAWIAPLIWTLIATTPFLEPSGGAASQIVGWLVQPADAGVATACAVVLAGSGAVAYTLRGCPAHPVTESH